MRLDQAWGFVGVSAALHDASGGYYGAIEGNGHPSDKFGYAVSPAFLWNSPFGLTGDAIAAQGVWSKGAAGYATPLFGPTAVFGAGTTLGVGWINEGVYTANANGVGGTDVFLTTVWSFNAAYEHRWNPQWRTSVYGGMIGVNYDDNTAKQLVCASVAKSAGIQTATQQCDPNFTASEIGTRTMWNPVPDLDVGVDLVWYHLNTAFGGSVATLPTTGAKPGGAYTLQDQNALSAVFRVQRNFLY